MVLGGRIGAWEGRAGKVDGGVIVIGDWARDLWRGGVKRIVLSERPAGRGMDLELMTI